MRTIQFLHTFLQSFSRSGPVRLTEFRLAGVGCVANVTLAEEEHLSMFFAAANWLAKEQVGMADGLVIVIHNSSK